MPGSGTRFAAASVMITLEEIPGIDADMALILQSAGIGSPSILEKLSAAMVVAELEKAVDGNAPP